MTRLRAFPSWLVVTIFGAIGTLQYYQIQFTSGFDTFFGDRGDARGVVYICEHWYRALFGKAHLMSPPIFYPTKGALAYTELLMGLAIPYSLLRAIGFSMFPSLEIVIIGVTVLSYVACFFLLHVTLRFNLWASCAAAMFFAFNSAKFFQSIHLQLQFVLFLPLILICVITFAREQNTISRRRATVLLSLASLLIIFQTFTTFYYTWFLVLWSIPFTALSLIFRPSRRFLIAMVRKRADAFIVAGAVMVAGALVFLWIFVPVIRAGQWYRYDFVLQMIPTWWSLLSMGEGNYVWGWLTRVVTPNPPPSTWGELRVSIGLLPSVVWLGLTAWSVRCVPRFIRATRKGVAHVNSTEAAPAFFVSMVLATTLFYLCGFRYWGDHSPWFFIFRFFPGGGAIRAVSRYVIFLSMPMAIGLAYALDAALQAARTPRKVRYHKAPLVVIILLACFGIFEQFGVPKASGTGFSTRVENAYLKAMAAKLPADCAAFFVTPGPSGKHNTAEYQYDAMLISAVSGVPTLNASMSQFPNGWGLYFVNDPNYETYVQQWIESQHITGKVCRLEIGPQVEAFDLHAANALDDATFFVRQHYRDLAGREPTDDELRTHVRNLQNCGQSYMCERAETSLDIFRGTGFAADGSFIYRLYQIALGRPPRYEEFTSDLPLLRAQPDRLAFVESFVARDEFAKHYASVADADYVTKLAENSEASLSETTRSALLTDHKSHAQILLDLVEDQDVLRKFENRAFVLLHYFGYLRRDPEPNGAEGWVHVLDTTRDSVRITAGFVSSLEYRQRFFYPAD